MSMVFENPRRLGQAERFLQRGHAFLRIVDERLGLPDIPARLFRPRAPRACRALISSRSRPARSKFRSFDASIMSRSSPARTRFLSPSRNRISRLMSSR